MQKNIAPLRLATQLLSQRGFNSIIRTFDNYIFKTYNMKDNFKCTFRVKYYYQLLGGKFYGRKIFEKGKIRAI